MSRVLLGVIGGLGFGAIDIGIMLPMSFPNHSTFSRNRHGHLAIESRLLELSAWYP